MPKQLGSGYGNDDGLKRHVIPYVYLFLCEDQDFVG